MQIISSVLRDGILSCFFGALLLAMWQRPERGEEPKWVKNLALWLGLPYLALLGFAPWTRGSGGGDSDPGLSWLGGLSSASDAVVVLSLVLLLAVRPVLLNRYGDRAGAALKICGLAGSLLCFVVTAANAAAAVAVAIRVF